MLWTSRSAFPDCQSVDTHAASNTSGLYFFSFIAGIETGRVEARGLHGASFYLFFSLYCHVIGVVF